MLDPSNKRAVGVALAVLLCAGGVFVWRFYPSDAPAPAFDGERALALVQRQVSFGPRAPGTAGHRRAQSYYVEALRSYAERVRTQPFTHERGDSLGALDGTNIIASFAPGDTSAESTRERRVLLAAHYDTRPWADESRDTTQRRQPVPGANDGASGVAVLLEVARLLARQPPAVGVDLVLFDLEDMGTRNAEDTTELALPFALGARHFAQNVDPSRYDYGILLDMVCDKNLRIPKEGHSRAKAPAVVEKVWAAAEEQGAGAFLEEPGPAVTDDHVPLLEKGVPVVDLVHAPFPWYWHTPMDTPAMCSAASLDQVGEVVTDVLYDE